MIRVNLGKEHGLQLLPSALLPTPSQEHVAPVPPVLPARPLLLESKSLPLEFLLARAGKVLLQEDVELPAPDIQRVIAQLIQAEAHEPNLHFKADYRQTMIAMCAVDVRRDVSTGLAALVAASYHMYGKHPDKLWPAIVARRKADLGKEYSRWYDENDNLIPQAGERTEEIAKLPGSLPSPRKPVQSVKPKKEDRNAA